MKGTGTFEATEGKGMEIVNFFEKTEGTWFSQRTTHFLPGQPSQTGQTTIHVTRLAPDDPRVTALCQQVDANPNQTRFALSIQQEEQAKTTYGSSSGKPERTTIFVGLKASDASIGKFVSQTDKEPTTTGEYRFESEVLTLISANEQLQSEERIWFTNPNLRLRTSLLKREDGFQMASFCSEVRRLTKPSG